MTELLTAAQMRAIEQAAIDSGQVTGLELMERAGRGVVEAVFEEWPELAATSHKAVVLCGPGNNGGDGFVVARLLKEWGWEVEVFLYGDAGKLPPDAKVNYERWLEMGEVKAIHLPDLEHVPWDSDVIIDALFGTGLSRALEFPLGNLIPEWDLRGGPARPRVVAIDMPSGLCSDSGKMLAGDGFWADLTVSFHSLKCGHMLGEGPFVCKQTVCRDIGLPHSIDIYKAGIGKELAKLMLESPCDMDLELLAGGRPADLVLLADPDLILGNLALGKTDPFGRTTHKYIHGHALILSGASGKGGAARLAARGALRIGAGVVTVGCPPEAVAENAAQLNAIMISAAHDADALAQVLQDTRINALCLGPALGKGAREQELVRVALEAKRPTVLDADALSILFFDKADALFGKLHDKCVLTPHAGEFARMFPDIAEKLNTPATTGPAYSKVDATREAAKRAGCVVLFKGVDTVIASPDGRAAINSAHYERVAPWLATAGSGDVLAGFITGLLARGFGPMQAAETAAWLHVECARSFGPGLIAEDLPEALPRVFKSLGI